MTREETLRDRINRQGWGALSKEETTEYLNAKTPEPEVETEEEEPEKE